MWIVRSPPGITEHPHPSAPNIHSFSLTLSLSPKVQNVTGKTGEFVSRYTVGGLRLAIETLICILERVELTLHEIPVMAKSLGDFFSAGELFGTDRAKRRTEVELSFLETRFSSWPNIGRRRRNIKKRLGLIKFY